MYKLMYFDLHCAKVKVGEQLQNEAAERGGRERERDSRGGLDWVMLMGGR